MRKLASLTPEKVFNYFEDICNIPHGSTNTKKISDYCANFAKTNNLEYNQDSLGNVVIKKPATAGYENSPSVILQGHMDMVCQKDTAISNIDMETQGLNIDINGDFIHANGTTLGGDDGISVAYILSILTDDTLQHPALEAVLTVDEEIGLLGATGMDMSQLKSKMMINIDTEEEGIFTTSCAGGVSANCHLPVTFENKTGTQVTVTVSGLLGGHSGVEIDKKRANGNKLMARFLNILSQKVNFGLVTLQGGTKDNAIP
ncbi:MAG: M20/M25/M40 family metallo-hydrolase, partial [Oscillospiraceae bacterium]